MSFYYNYSDNIERGYDESAVKTIAGIRVIGIERFTAWLKDIVKPDYEVDELFVVRSLEELVERCETTGSDSYEVSGRYTNNGAPATFTFDRYVEALDAEGNLLSADEAEDAAEWYDTYDLR